MQRIPRVPHRTAEHYRNNAVAAPGNAVHPRRRTQTPQIGNRQQVLHRRRRRPETILQLRLHAGNLPPVSNAGKPLIKRQPRRQMRHILLRYAGRNGQVNARRLRLRLGRNPAPVLRLQIQLGHRLTQQIRVQVETNRVDLPALVGPQQVAGPPNFQVPHCNAKTRPQFVSLQNGVNTLAGRLGNLPPGGQQQVSVSPVVAPPHPPPQLVKLRQTKAVGPVNNNGVHIRHIQPGLNDGGANQHIRLPVGEGNHHLLKLVLRHLPVSHQKARLGRQPA